MKTTILLADDHQIVRQGLRSLLERNDDMQVVGEASDGRTAVKLARETSPDVIVMDIGMPHLNGIEATRQVLASEGSRTKVVALSMHSDRRFIGEMLKAGAKAYLLKDGAFEELAGAVRSVMAGKVYLSPRITDVVVDDYLRNSAAVAGGAAGAGSATGSSDTARRASVYGKLTAREREVLQLMSEGRSTKEIAMDLNVSVKTVETHRRQIMEKLDIHSVAELTKYAIREGLTTLEN